jgi:uncharacterized membrane protein
VRPFTLLLGLVAACAPEGALPITEGVASSSVRIEKGPSYNVPLRLVGQGPSWTGRVARDGLRIGGMSPGRVYVPWFDPVVSGGVARWRAQTSAGLLEITLIPGPCSDGTEQRYSFSATVVLGAATLRGCAAPETDFTWVE